MSSHALDAMASVRAAAIELFDKDASSALDTPPLEAYVHEARAYRVQPRTVGRAIPKPPVVEAFPVVALADALTEPRSAVVQRLIESGTVLVVAGAPNSGKTALAIDLAEHVAAGVAWFGLKVSGSPVIYVAAEAPGSVVMRAHAAVDRKFRGRRLPVFIVTASPLLGDDVYTTTEADRLIAALRVVESMEGEQVKLVVLDTLASCLGNGDENGDGMMRLVAATKRIALETGAAVAIVHHPSKSDAAGLRGHGSLAAAVDTIINVTTDAFTSTRTATLTKSRDSATGLQLSFVLEMVVLPELDQFGDPRTTIIVKPVATPKPVRPTPKGKRQQELLTELERRYRTGETGWDEATMRRAARDLGIVDQSARDAVKGLVTAGYLTGSQAHMTLKFPPESEGTK